MTNTITIKDFLALSHRDRAFYLEHKDDLEMKVVDGKLHFVVHNNQPHVSWERFNRLLILWENLTETERELLHIYTNYGDWNSAGMPYLDYGFYYYINIDISGYKIKKLGIEQDAKIWLINWLISKGFTPEDAATVKYTGGISGHNPDGTYYHHKSYGFEARCRFTDVPAHYLPTKVLKWAKKNAQYKHLIFA